MVQGVIFDMDGLMFDSERVWSTFWAPALAEMGETEKPGIADATRGSTGDALRAIIRQFYGPQFDADTAVAKLNALAAASFKASAVPPKPGLATLLAWLKARGIPMAVASSSPEELIWANLDNNHMRDYFDAVVPGAAVARSKPAPDIFLAAAKAIGTEPGHTLVLEDSFNGVRAGAAGGFVTVMVPDLMQPNDEMRALAAAVLPSLDAVRAGLEAGTL